MRLFCALIVVFMAILPTCMVKGECKDHTLSNAKGTVVYPANATKGDTCKIIIKVEGKAPDFIALMVSNVMLPSDGKIDVFDGDTTPNLRLFSTSGNSLPEHVLVTFSNNVIIKYTVGDDNPDSGWVMSYDSKECARTVSNPWAVKLEAPKYLSIAKKAFQCKYIVNSSLPADRIPVASVQLDLSSKSSLELQNGDNSVKFTDGSQARDFYALNNSVPIDVIFDVPDASANPTFTLVVDPLVQGCSSSMHINETYSLNLSIPVDHPVQYRCRWLITAQATTAKVLAKVTGLSLVDTIDFLTFTDGSSSATTDQTLVSLSANPTPGYLVATTGNSLIVSLNLGNSYVERKVEIDFSPQEDGGRFTGEGTLQVTASKPEEDHDADVDKLAYFQLVASPGEVVSIQVLTALPENATLSFYNGLQTTDKLLTVFNSETTDLNSLTGSAEMLLVLEKFPSTENFTASFSSVEPGCDMTLTDASGQLTFSDLLLANATKNCTLTIAPYNTLIGTLVLNFDTLTVGDDDSVLIYSGETLVAEFNKKLGQASELYISEVTMARIVVTNGGDETTHTSMMARYAVQANACGSKLSLGKGDITTPNYPNEYPLNAQCAWPVVSQVEETPGAAPATNSLYLNFKSLNLAPGHFIDVSDTNNGSAEPLGRFGDNVLPDDFIVPMKEGLNVMFHANPKDAAMSNEVKTGADIGYMVVSCGGNISAESGTFTSPGYPKAPSKSDTCVWIIHVADPAAADGANETSIVRFKIALKDKTATAMPAYFKVHDGASMRSPDMEVKVTKGATAQILSRYNKLVLQYAYTVDTKTKDTAGFTLTYSTYNCNSSELCDNGVCLHPDWRCNGADDCGDFTDERGCVPKPVPIVTTPKPSSGSSTSGYVKGGFVALVFFIALILGAVLVVVVPKIIRRLRGGNANYSRMHDGAPVVT